MPAPATVRESSAARLADLEEKRQRYEALSRKLFTLPQKLRHPGLIPVGPRLHLPGELVHTNQLTVLLGEGYFAERSASQAQGIVQRRLVLIDERVKEVHVPPCKPEELVARPEDGHGKAAEAGIRKSARAMRSTIGPNAKESTPGVGHTAVGRSSSLGGVGDDPPSSSSAKRGDEGLPGVMVDVGNGSVRAAAPKLKKRVSFREPLITEVVPSKSQNSFRSSDKSKKPTKKAAIRPPSSAKREDPRAVRSEMAQAIANASKQVMQDGYVNFAEIFEGSSEKPTRVELPTGFQPDPSVNFDQDSEEYLDLTGPRAARADEGLGSEYLRAMADAEEAAEAVKDENSRDDAVESKQSRDSELESRQLAEQSSRYEYLQALLDAEEDDDEEAEDAEDAEQSRKEEEESKKSQQREEKEFGNGFAKGFFGAAPVKRATAKEKEVGTGVGKKVVGNGSFGHEGETEVEPLEHVEAGGEPAIEERVVERRATKRGTRRQRKPRASSILAMSRSAAARVLSDETVGYSAEGASVEENGAGAARRSVSKFRQMRDLQRRDATTD